MQVPASSPLLPGRGHPAGVGRSFPPGTAFGSSGEETPPLLVLPGLGEPQGRAGVHREESGSGRAVFHFTPPRERVQGRA